MSILETVRRIESQGAILVTLEIETAPRTLKKGRDTGAPCPYRRLTKRTRIRAFLGAQYQSSVNRQRAREGTEADFEALPVWNGAGRHISKALIEHVGTGALYVAYYPYQVDGKPAPTETVWLDDGEPVAKPDAEFLPVPSTGNRQGTDKPVAWRTVKIENVISISNSQGKVS